VDVEACSFVIVFDNIKTQKAYVQMKGRARRKDAYFFVFQGLHKIPHISLQQAQETQEYVWRIL